MTHRRKAIKDDSWFSGTGKVKGMERCGIYCDNCTNNYKKVRKGCDLYPNKITNPDVKDKPEEILRKKLLKKEKEENSIPCPKCGARMELKTVHGITHINQYYKCFKCHWLKVYKK